jgi:hypothetical protein
MVSVFFVRKLRAPHEIPHIITGHPDSFFGRLFPGKLKIVANVIKPGEDCQYRQKCEFGLDDYPQNNENDINYQKIRISHSEQCRNPKFPGTDKYRQRSDTNCKNCNDIKK